MTDVDSTASNISLTWGSRPSTLHLIAFSAGVAVRMSVLYHLLGGNA